ncbi:aldehyde dehydrogenase [Salibacterium salarium]|uniref:3-sulfolactaldehyde dehydrogenase n=1 Tax=Salibacterium salarium TaxID=284579 RepID=A0A428N0R9_9BACI|nr:aldehyde dehydrogenase family protein [Salibacterium salarium]RSL31937.1 aldehyde dehydrogenase [Salibacterium salarium]
MLTNGMKDWVNSNSGNTNKNFINGEWVESVNGKTSILYESGNPSNKLGEFPYSTEEDVNKAVKAADEAFKQWRREPLSNRASLLYRFSDLLEKNQEELAYIISAEQGKTLGESRGEVRRAAIEAKFTAGEVFRLEGTTFPSEDSNVHSEVRRYPIGVISAISPWNFPVVTPVRKLSPAIAYGCTVVLKPASATPWTSVKLVQLLEEAGLPKGVVNLIIGSGNKTGDRLVDHPLVKGISFTGSTNLGVRINEKAASKLIRTQLELGGKNPAIVLDYENLREAAQQIVSAAFTTSGQRCTALSRVIVLKDQSHDLTNEIIDEMKKIKVGPPWNEDATMGPLVNRQHYETVQEYINFGKQEGAKLTATEGEFLYEQGEGGYYIRPILFTKVTKNMKIAQEEIFGPVLVMLEVEDKEEAIELANSTNYGLAASVFTDQLSLGHEFIDRIQAGMVHINHGTASQPHIPFGGTKDSGFGAFSIGHSNQEFFTEMRTSYTKYK